MTLLVEITLWLGRVAVLGRFWTKELAAMIAWLSKLILFASLLVIG